MRPKRDRGKVESRPRLCNRQNHLEDQPGQQSVYTAQQWQQAVPAVNRPAQPAMPLAAGPTGRTIRFSRPGHPVEHGGLASRCS